MLHEDEVEAPADGRVARRERNIAAVLDVVIEMFSEDKLFPTIEQASKRSGLSLRSLYRYFSDPGELHQAAIAQHRKKTVAVSHLPGIGTGPLEQRIDDFVSMRMDLYAVAAPVFRATVHTAGTNEKVREGLDAARREMREQFERQFAPELEPLTRSVRTQVIAAGDVLTQLDSIDLLRDGHGLSRSAATASLQVALAAILSP